MIFQSREVFPSLHGRMFSVFSLCVPVKTRERTLKIPRFRTQKDLIGETKFCKSRFIFLSCKQKSLFLLHFFTLFFHFFHFATKRGHFYRFCKHFYTTVFYFERGCIKNIVTFCMVLADFSSMMLSKTLSGLTK